MNCDSSESISMPFLCQLFSPSIQLTNTEQIICSCIRSRLREKPVAKLNLTQNLRRNATLFKQICCTSRALLEPKCWLLRKYFALICFAPSCGVCNREANAPWISVEIRINVFRISRLKELQIDIATKERTSGRNLHKVSRSATPVCRLKIKNSSWKQLANLHLAPQLTLRLMENGAKQICDLVSPTIARRWRKSTERFSLGASCRRSSLKSSPEISIRNFADAFACRARGRRGGKRDREGEGGKE